MTEVRIGKEKEFKMKADWGKGEEKELIRIKMMKRGWKIWGIQCRAHTHTHTLEPHRMPKGFSLNS